MLPGETKARGSRVNSEFESGEHHQERPSLAPPRLPRLSSTLSNGPGLGSGVAPSRASADQSDHLAALSSLAETRYRHGSPQDWSRGRSASSSGEATRIELPGVATLMLPRAVGLQATQQTQQRSSDDTYYAASVEQQQFSNFPQDRQRAQSSPTDRFHAYSSSSTTSAAPDSPPTTAHARYGHTQGVPGRSRRWDSAPVPLSTGLEGLAGARMPGEMQQRHSRWTPYPTVASATPRFQARPMAALHPAAAYWDDDDEFEDAGAYRSQRRRRMSPRRRLAASKVRAQTWGAAVERGGQPGLPPALATRGYQGTNPPFAGLPPSLLASRPLLPPPVLPPTSLSQGGATDTSPSKKSSRYLREMDRRVILERLDRGEKQSALAKEFRVTRAAICNLNKQRALVLARSHENPQAKHPKKSKRKAEIESEMQMEGKGQAEVAEVTIDRSASASPAVPVDKPLPVSGQCGFGYPHVYTVALQPAERLLPLLLSRTTSDEAFRRYCDRLMTLVVEETLAWAHAEAHKRLDSVAAASDKPPTACGVAVQPQGAPLLAVFRELEPELPTGSVAMDPSQLSAVLELPPMLAAHTVCLFYAFTDAVGGARVAASIRALLERGAVEELLCLVTLAVSTLTVEELQRAYPSLRIAAAHVESEAEAETWRCQSEHTGPETKTKIEGTIGVKTGQHGRLASRLEVLSTRVAQVY